MAKNDGGPAFPSISLSDLSTPSLACTAGMDFRGVLQERIDDVLGDIFASEQYRRSVAPVWVKRALTQAAKFL